MQYLQSLVVAVVAFWTWLPFTPNPEPEVVPPPVVVMATTTEESPSITMTEEKIVEKDGVFYATTTVKVVTPKKLISTTTVATTTPPPIIIPVEVPIGAAPIPQELIQAVPPTIIQINTPQVQQPAPPAQPTKMDQSKINVTLANRGKVDAQNDMPFGSYIFKVSVTNPDGSYSNDAVIRLDAPNSAYVAWATENNVSLENNPNVVKKVNGIVTGKKEDPISYWEAPFEYIPTQAGPVTLTFSSGNLDREYDLIVE